MTTTVRFRPRRPALLAFVVATVVVTLTPTVLAAGAWSAAGSGSAGAAAAVMPTGLAPTAVNTRDSVTVRWPAVTLSSGAAVAGYTITRTNAINGATVAPGGTCAGTVTTTTCTEIVPPGQWTYTDTPVLSSWTGGQSPPSNTITAPLT